MLRPVHSLTLTLTLALVACTGPNGSDTRITSESSSGSSATGTSSEGSSTPTDGGTGPDSTTVDITSGSDSQAETRGSTSTTATGEGTTEDPTETGGEDPFKVGIALKRLCSPDPTSMCGVTPDDELVCWGNVDHPSFKVPPGKLKSVSQHCFLVVLESGELHRLRDYPSQPLDLPGGPFVLAGGDYPYGCAMAANNEVTCWVAEGYTVIEVPPPGPYVALDDAREGNCQMCGIRGDGSLVCWKRPVKGDWGASCNAFGWNGATQGTYTKFIDSNFHSVRLMNDMGQLVWFEPEFGSISVAPLFASGGFTEADALVGLRQSGELLYFENGMGDGVPLLPGPTRPSVAITTAAARSGSRTRASSAGARGSTDSSTRRRNEPSCCAPRPRDLTSGARGRRPTTHPVAFRPYHWVRAIHFTPVLTREVRPELLSMVRNSG